MSATTTLLGKGIKIDPEDEWVGANWTRRSDGYCVRRVNGQMQYLHRLIMGCVVASYPMVDHINGDPSDNRRANLRFATAAENQQNRHGATAHSQTGVRGVHFDKATGKFRAQFTRNGEKVNVGRFMTLAEAAAAVEAAR